MRRAREEMRERERDRESERERERDTIAWNEPIRS